MFFFIEIGRKTSHDLHFIFLKLYIKVWDFLFFFNFIELYESRAFDGLWVQINFFWLFYITWSIIWKQVQSLVL